MRRSLLLLVAVAALLAAAAVPAVALEQAPGPDLVVEKTGPAQVAVGADIDFRIVVRNDGDTTAESVTATDRIPDGVELRGSDSGPTSNGDEVSCSLDDATPPVLTCTTADLEPGERFEFGVRLGKDEPGTVSNTATATNETGESDPDDNSSTAQTVVGDGGPEANLSVYKDSTRGLPPIGASQQFRLQVSNFGDADAPDVVLTDTLPDGYDYVAAGSDARCTETSDDVVECDLGTVTTGGPSQSTEVLINTTTVAGGQFFNSATVTSSAPDSDLADNTTSAQAVVCSWVGTPGPDVKTATDPGQDVLCGRGGNDTLTTNSGFDFLAGEGGNDLLVQARTTNPSDGMAADGGAGDDVFGAGFGFDFVVGGPGRDRITYATSPARVVVTLGTPGTDEFENQPQDERAPFTSGNGVDGPGHGRISGQQEDFISPGTEDVNGTTFGDDLTGGATANTLSGNLGPDLIHGGGGADAVRGNDGDDTLFGDAGDDVVQGNAGADELHDGLGLDQLLGQEDADTLFTSSDGAADYVNCGDGTDAVTRGERGDTANRNCETVGLSART